MTSSWQHNAFFSPPVVPLSGHLCPGRAFPLTLKERFLCCVCSHLSFDVISGPLGRRATNLHQTIFAAHVSSGGVDVTTLVLRARCSVTRALMYERRAGVTRLISRGWAGGLPANSLFSSTLLAQTSNPFGRTPISMCMFGWFLILVLFCVQ